jgi:hypothetical protein
MVDEVSGCSCCLTGGRAGSVLSLSRFMYDLLNVHQILLLFPIQA